MRINILILFALVSCAPVSPSVPKGQLECPEQNKMQVAYDAQAVSTRSYDVQTAMGVVPSEVINGVDVTQDYVARNGDRVCATFRFEFHSDALVSKRVF